MKQTAVEWFAEQDTLVTIDFLEGKLNQLQLAMKKTTILENAKAMEKEMYFKFFKAGQESMEEGGKGFDQYYETYKSE